MKAKDGVVGHVNTILSAELAAINQSFVHGKLCEHWGFTRLHRAIRARSLEAMNAADRFIGHILYLESMPHVHHMPAVELGESVSELFRFDLRVKRTLLELLSEGVRHCASVGDFTTRHLLEERVEQIDAHIDWVETQLAAIGEIGLELYLAEQLYADD